ncbi:MAG: ABC transporter substrate-binding protein [Streptosporangiales bacterium]|nr:ABC transporter substrate-binding protein [Streptosporangiales bacterium]MBO0892643.1 ABC transporter substrate-binding protein [Acidothermales bacterium]
MKEGAIGDDISFEMQYVADKDGFFKKQGLKTEQITTSSGVTATQALISGDLDVVNAGGSEILKAIAKGAKLKIIAPDIETFPYLLVSGKAITTAQQLKGKAVGISQVGSSSYYGVVAGLQALGVPKDSVSLRQVGGESARLGAVSSGAVAATAVGAQLKSGVAKAHLNVLANLASDHIAYAQDYLVTTEKFISDHPGFVTKYRKGLERARAFLFDPKNKTEVLKDFKDLFQVDANSPVPEDAYEYTMQEKGPYLFPEGLKVSKKVFNNTVKLTDVSIGDRPLSDLVADGVPLTD